MSLDKIVVVKHTCAFESVIDIFLQLLGLCIVYWLFKEMGESLIGDTFTPDLLLSLVVLPSIMVLKDIGSILDPYFIGVTLKGETVSVTTGVLTKFEDSLSLKTVENIEVVTTFFGRLKGYSTLRVYTYGSWIEIPNIKNAKGLKLEIENIMNVKTLK